MRAFSFVSCSSLALCLGLSLSLSGCDKKKDEAAPAPSAADDAQSVADGAKPRTAAGQQVEIGKQRVNEAEAKLQARDDAILNAADQDGSVNQRGM